MTWVATAVAGAAVVGAGASVASGSMQSSADSAAAGMQQSQYSNTAQLEAPFVQAGSGATTALAELLGVQPGSYGALPNGYLTQQQTAPFSFDPSSITSSPGYQFAQQQGLSAVANSEAPNVGALSGPALKALTSFSTGTAEQYYNDYYNQALNTYNTNFSTQQTSQNNIFNRLSALAGIGQSAASQQATSGSQLATGAAQATAASGASQGAAAIGVGNAASSAANGYALSSILSANSASNPLATGSEFDGTAQGTLISGVGAP